MGQWAQRLAVVAVAICLLPLLGLRPASAPKPAPPLTSVFTKVAPPVTVAQAAETHPWRALSRSERVAAIPPENPSEAAVLSAAREFRIPEDVALALTVQESGGNPELTSSTGAAGLTQVQPSTAVGIARKLGLMSYNLFDPQTNARFGMFYLREQWDREKNLERALRAYNAGPGAVEASYDYPETNDYVRSIFALKEVVFDLRANVPTLRTFRSGVKITQGISEGNHTGDGFDNGTDLIPTDPNDTAVLATFDGTIIEHINQPALCGYGVKVRSPSGRYIGLWCHLAASSTLLDGANVSQGDILGKMGSSGEATGPHTHYSVVYSTDNGMTYHLFHPRSQ